MMLTHRYRPKDFKGIIGQEVATAVLTNTIKNPDMSPRVYILHGDFGTGKTSAARILAHKLNCNSHCPVCKNNDYNTVMREFDGGDVNMEAIRNFKESLHMVNSLVPWRVAVFDEWHLTPRSTQSALLKTLEDITSNVFFVFCTTDIDRVINPLRSRSIELPFVKVPDNQIKKLLGDIDLSEDIGVDSQILALMSVYAHGHVRDAILMLDHYRMVGRDAFLQSLPSSEVDTLKLLICIKEQNKGCFQDLLRSILSNPLSIIEQDFYRVIKNLIEMFACESSQPYCVNLYEQALSLWKADIFKLFQTIMQPWATGSFKNDHTLQAFLWSIYYMGQGKKKDSSSNRQSLLQRARKN